MVALTPATSLFVRMIVDFDGIILYICKVVNAKSDAEWLVEV